MWIVSQILGRIFSRKFGTMKEKWSNMMFFNGWITFFNETYLFLALCACLNCCYLKFGSFGDVTNSLLTLICCVLIIALPLFTAIFYNVERNFKLIRKKDK